MYAEVQSVEQLSPSMVRIVLTGGRLAEFETPAATDAYINAQFPPPGVDLAVPFERSDLDDLPADQRPKPRRYTIRSWDPERLELAIDFVAHGDNGYAGTWAQRARPGDRLQFKGPGGSYRPSPDVDWHLLVGDESALGAIGASLDSLTPDSRALVFAVVDDADHEIELPSRAGVDVTWLHRCQAADPETLLADAVAAAPFPEGTFDVFVHGEAAEVRDVRKHLVADRAVDVDTASISPYWRRNHTDEAWRQIKRQWMAEQLVDA